MNFQKIVGLAGIALSVIGAFVAMPNLAMLLVILGLIGGLWIDFPDQVRVIVSALALTALSTTLSAIPGIGSYLTSIVGSLGVLASGVAIMIILRNIYNRFKP